MCKLLLKHYETTLLVSKSSIIFEGLSILRSKRRLTLLTFIYWLRLSACTSAQLPSAYASALLLLHLVLREWKRQGQTCQLLRLLGRSFLYFTIIVVYIQLFTTSTTIMQQYVYTASNVSKYSAKSPTIRRLLFEICVQLRGTRVTLRHWNWDAHSQDRRCHLCVYLQQRDNMYNKLALSNVSMCNAVSTSHRRLFDIYAELRATSDHKYEKKIDGDVRHSTTMSTRSTRSTLPLVRVWQRTTRAHTVDVHFAME